MRDPNPGLSFRLIVCVAALHGWGTALSQVQHPESVCEGSGIERAGENSGVCPNRNRNERKSEIGGRPVAGGAEAVVEGDDRRRANGDRDREKSAPGEDGAAEPIDGANVDRVGAAAEVSGAVGECVGRRFKKCR